MELLYRVLMYNYVKTVNTIDPRGKCELLTIILALTTPTNISQAYEVR